MVIDFSKIDLEDIVFKLKTLSEDVICSLPYRFESKAEINYNDISNLNFNYPACIDGTKVNGYDDLVGMRVIDVMNVGQFILIDPSIEQEGIREYKECKAYSLEYEFTFKKISVENGTYNFWNPVSPNDTILGRIMEKMPTWNVGEVAPSLIGKYRTFEENGSNVYNFIKSKLQETYHCVFEFDTYKRLVHVRDVNTEASISPVYLSMNNLLKKIDIKEDTENIFTVLDVNGAEGVDIRSVNPIGTNKIYNLDYFMNEKNFSPGIVSKWATWKDSFKNAQLQYYNLTIEMSLQISKRLTDESALSDLNGELKSLENLRATYIQAVSQGIADKQADLDTVNAQITAKKQDMSRKTEKIQETKDMISGIDTKLVAVNNSLAFESFFTEDEIFSLSRYFKEDSITESSFVSPVAQTYNTAGFSNQILDVDCSMFGANITKTQNELSKYLFSIKGGTLSVGDITANIVRASMEQRPDDTFLFSAYLNSGTYGENQFESGCVSISGTCTNMSDNSVPDSEMPDAYSTGTELAFHILSSDLYLTKNTTEYEQYAIEWDLFDYGAECLEKLAYPSYTFSVESANFFTLEEFKSFQDNLVLGDKIYLGIDDENILSPVCVKVAISFDDMTSVSFGFSDTYSYKDSAFQLVDLLDQGISMGKTVDFSKYKYSSFIDSGTQTSVKSFMESALDVAKNAILSSQDQAISWDASGFHLREWNADKTGYLDEEIAMINNSIVFTNDGWKTSKMAIGKFIDSNSGESWGIVAPSIVGTLLAGKTLVIESAKKDGGKSVFKVDANGAVLHNSKFDILSASNTQILLDPILGIGIGQYPIVTTDDSGAETWDVNNSRFWVDIEGNLHLKCNLDASTGNFSGDVTVKNLYFQDGTDVKTLLSKEQTKIPRSILDLGNITLDGDTGNISMTGGISMGGDITLGGDINFSNASSIKWGNNTPVKYQFATSLTGSWHDTMQVNDKYRRDSLDGGLTWGDGYQFKGTNGSDANVPDWVQDYTASAQYNTLVNDEWVISMNLYGTNIYGANYYSEDKNTLMDLLNRDDYILGSGGGVKFSVGSTEIFQVASNQTGFAIDFSSLGYNFLSTSYVNGKITSSLKGVLNLTGCQVTWGGNFPNAVFG